MTDIADHLDENGVSNRDRREDVLRAIRDQFTDRNPALFAYICDELGEQPSESLRFFYDKGKADLEFGRPEEADLVDFLGNGLRLNADDINSDIGDKQYMLMEYFPKRFGEGAPEDLNEKEITNKQIGQKFRLMYREVQKKLGYEPKE